MPEFLKASEIKDIYGYSRYQLRKFEEDGRLSPHYTAGGQRRYVAHELQAIAKGVTQKASEPPRSAYKEFGTTGARNSWNAPWEERQKELSGHRGRLLKREMRINDPIFGAVFFALTNSLRQAEMRIRPASESPEDKERADFIQGCFHDMSWSWADQFSVMVEPMFEQGFSVLEIVYKKRLGEKPPNYTKNPAKSAHNDGLIGWRKWSPRPAETLTEDDEWIFDDNGGVIGVNQDQPEGAGKIPIPIDKLLHFRTTIHPGNTPEGIPIHRAAYQPYFYTQNLQEIEGIAIERTTTGLPVVYLGTDRTMSGPESDFETAKELVTNIRWDDQMGVVFPGPKQTQDGRGFHFELASPEKGNPWDISSVILRYNREKALVVLAQFIMMGLDKVGSFALARVQVDLFKLAAQAWLDSIAGVINRHAIPKLFEMNAWSGPYPQVVFQSVAMPDLADISMFINSMVERQVITPDDALERHVRQIAGLPPMTETTEEDDDDPNTEDGKPGVRKFNKRKIDLHQQSIMLMRLRNSLQPLVDIGMLSVDQMKALIQPTLETVVGGIQGSNELLMQQVGVNPQEEIDLEDNVDNEDLTTEERQADNEDEESG